MGNKKANQQLLCPCCMKQHPEEVVKYRTLVTFKGVHVEYDAISCYCRETDEYYDTEEQMTNNDRSLKNAYRASTGLMTAEEIRNLRDDYGISQQDLCILLGWGEKTIARYEGHQVQDKAHDLILRKLKEDPAWFIELLDASKGRISKRAYNKYMTNAKKACLEAMPEYERRIEAVKAFICSG